jgi:RNase H-fold protein (predicted Holliday junction resolvase)
LLDYYGNILETELDLLRTAISETYTLGRIVVANPNLTEEQRSQGEQAVRTLLSLLFKRLNKIEHAPAVLPANIKSDY